MCVYVCAIKKKVGKRGEKKEKKTFGRSECLKKTELALVLVMYIHCDC